VVRPVGGTTGILLARADGEDQESAVGRQFSGRVGLFLRVDDFDAAHARLVAAGVTFVRTPRTEPFGKVAVFVDVAGNRWDLLGPRLDDTTPAPPREPRLGPSAMTVIDVAGAVLFHTERRVGRATRRDRDGGATTST
jgi:catechol 2,3-dioxygenase-like lactoylglutathione lyase family enzyme